MEIEHPTTADSSSGSSNTRHFQPAQIFDRKRRLLFASALLFLRTLFLFPGTAPRLFTTYFSDK